MGVRSSAISSSEKASSSILQVCSIMSEAIKSKKKPRFFSLFGYYKKDIHHSLPYHSHVLMNKFLIRFGHSDSLSLSLSLSLSIEFIPK
jgi:hypothetical protein